MSDFSSHPEDPEQSALLAEIHAAFAGVTREGGVSWSQAYVHDMDYIVRAAIPDDPDRHWADLIGNPQWRIEAGLGGFSFLDPIGFRYYLAAALCRMVTEPENGDILFHLTLPRDKDWIAYHLDKWSLLDDRQRRVVARFLDFMDRHEEPELLHHTEDADDDFWHPWQAALNSYWKQFL